ncbi:Fucose 4-O-acetylase and related acetyltransferases [Klebsiella pneumoniae]|uniref:hypothetical protein n=1 Tax=Klebsiella pneumoniae TaxID=573 RepID=UPI0007CA2045|nr:hypothetical protein [Klebsiella pneumoniae]SAR60086.1 Fucose 4-O-acetylase and related acetyltransferases [Klebsiella pneumoniae]
MFTHYSSLKNFFKRVFKAIYKRVYIVSLKFINNGFIFRRKNKPIYSDVIVSLTSHGKRIDSVYLTIESILNGKVLPSKVILWLDNEKQYNNLPITLRRMIGETFEVRLTNNYGPHTKYYPYILQSDFSKLLVTADDDILYPKKWLCNLIKANSMHPNFICCFRAHRILFDNEGNMLNYNDWVPCCDMNANFSNFATGVSGVIYPREIQKFLYDEGDGFLDKCPNADDVWLHYIAVKYGFRIKQITSQAIHFPIIDNTQDIALFNSNVLSNRNQEQINCTYTKDALDLILKDFSSTSKGI